MQRIRPFCWFNYSQTKLHITRVGLVSADSVVDPCGLPASTPPAPATTRPIRAPADRGPLDTVARSPTRSALATLHGFEAASTMKSVRSTLDGNDERRHDRTQRHDDHAPGQRRTQRPEHSLPALGNPGRVKSQVRYHQADHRRCQPEMHVTPEVTVLAQPGQSATAAYPRRKNPFEQDPGADQRGQDQGGGHVEVEVDARALAAPGRGLGRPNWTGLVRFGAE